MDDDKVWNGALTNSELHARVGAVAGPQTDRVIEAYRALLRNASPTTLLIAALTRSNFWVRSVLLAERKAARRAPVYMYSFAWETPAFAGRLKSHHTRTRHIGGRPRYAGIVEDKGQIDRELAATVSATWAAFAHRLPGKPGDPAMAGLYAGGARDDGSR
jgi:para-nitrobenzyl esterase